jgi:type IV secretory pathway component VirB8
MNQQMPESDEEKARKILAAFRHLERRERLKARTNMLFGILMLILVLAIVIVILVNLQKFRLFYQLLNQPDSLLLN